MVDFKDISFDSAVTNCVSKERFKSQINLLRTGGQ